MATLCTTARHRIQHSPVTSFHLWKDAVCEAQLLAAPAAGGFAYTHQLKGYRRNHAQSRSYNSNPHPPNSYPPPPPTSSKQSSSGSRAEPSFLRCVPKLYRVLLRKWNPKLPSSFTTVIAHCLFKLLHRSNRHTMTVCFHSSAILTRGAVQGAAYFFRSHVRER